MSIITEALKKAENEKNSKKSQEQSSQAVEAVQEIKKKEPETVSLNSQRETRSQPVPYEPPTKVFKEKKQFPVKAVFLIGFILLILAVSGFFVFQFFSKSDWVLVTSKQEKQQEELVQKNTSQQFAEKEKVLSAPKDNIFQPTVNRIQEIVVQSNPLKSSSEKNRIKNERLKKKFNVTGVIDDPESPAVIINNRIVELGEEIQGATVIRINQKGVTLLDDGQEVFLTL